ncbi:COG4315 family predicted lipoprotein [Streptomyces sp. NBC_00388]|uniref:COG4315 family predicted lipoprotein n=1 Tax=Streptomyces sp. NBC_00388 TaxID=2975735 RepID=UPI002E1E6248
MRSSISTAAAVAAAGLFAVAVTGCAGGSKAQVSGAGSSPSSSMTESSSPSATASVRTVMVKKTPLGKILVNGKGRTLYLFEADKTSKSTCTGACAKAWPPLLAKNTPTAGSEVQTKLLSTSPRSTGGKQVTYKGHPLYTFLGDHNKAGQTNGQGLTQFGAKWYVVGPDGKKITAQPKASSSPSSSSSSSPSSSSSSGSGY